MDLNKNLRFIDLFCGIGGFRIAMGQAAKELGYQSCCVFSSDIDVMAHRTYAANFGETPTGDITKVEAETVPDHDLLFGGFPCQAFSIIGEQRGFSDTRGTLFFDIARILEKKRPTAFVLENVKQLKNHDSGKTLKTILSVLKGLGYFVHYKVLNALDYGVPQKRERIFIVGFSKDIEFEWPEPVGRHPHVESILEKNPDEKYMLNKKIKESLWERVNKNKLDSTKMVWHENKSGNIGVHDFSCALRAGASFNYLTVNGERRLTGREMLRIQGFPDEFKIVVPYGAIRKQAGNSVAVPCVKAVISKVLWSLKSDKPRGIDSVLKGQLPLPIEESCLNSISWQDAISSVRTQELNIR